MILLLSSSLEQLVKLWCRATTSCQGTLVLLLSSLLSPSRRGQILFDPSSFFLTRSFLTSKTLLPKKFLSSRFLHSMWIKLSAYFLSHLLSCKVEIFSQYVGAGMTQWWEHSPTPTVARVRFLDLASHVGWVCCSVSSLRRGFFSGFSGFPSSKKNKHSLFEFHCHGIRSLRKI